MAEAKRYAIRRANYNDVARIATLVAAMADETGRPPPERPHADHILIDQIKQEAVYLACELYGPADRPTSERLVGALILGLRDVLMNSAFPVVETEHFFLLPEVRGAKMDDGKFLGDGLVEIAKIVATRIGAPLLTRVLLGMVDDPKADVRDRFLKRHGMMYAGGWFLWTPPQEKKQAAE